MWRCLSRTVIPTLIVLTTLALMCLWLLASEDEGDGLLILDQERDQYDRTVALHESSKIIRRQIVKSEHRNIEHRSQFQKKQVKKFCGLYGNKLYTFPEGERQREELYRHLLFDDSRKTIFCFAEKTGCTNMKRLMFVSVGQLGVNTAQDEWVDLKYLERGIKHASLLNKSLTEEDRMRRLKEYYKFTVIRNPLERLVSGYRNKIEPPLTGNSLKFPNYLKRRIFEQYRPVVYHYWLKAGANYNITITFSEFVEYYIESFKDSLNSHIKPFTGICHPCSIPFDFYIHFNNYSQDVKMVVNKVGMNWNHFYDKSLYSSPNTSTALIMHQYYQRLPRMQRARLYDVIRDELLFYYHLFPAERNSHKTLLGVEEHLYHPHTT